MGKRNRRVSHTVSWLTVHIVWVTKYRYKVLKGDIQLRCRTLIRQVCESEDVEILKGVVSKDHVHLHLKRYWGRHFWAIGYGAWTTGNITDKMVEEYLEHHRKKGGGDDAIILD